MAVSGISTTSPPSLSRDDSEESFVVLSRSPGPEFQNLLSLNSTDSNSPNAGSIHIPSLRNDVPHEVSVTTSLISDLSAEEIQSKMESILQENMELKDTLKQNSLAMKKQFNTLIMWQEDVMKVHKSHKEKFEETKKLIASLRAENGELKKLASAPVSYTSSDDTTALKSKISALEFELQTLREANINYKIQHSELIKELEVKLELTEKESKEMATKLNNEKDELKAKLDAAEEKMRVALTKIEELKSQLVTEADIRNSDYLKAQINELTNEVILKAKMLKEKTDLIDKLHEEISKLKIENEVIPILKTQVDVYQTDFNQERSARNLLKEEKDRLANDLYHLQHRNQQLLEQLDSSYVHVVSSSSAPSTTERQGERFVCPICDFAFFDCQALENHVDRHLSETLP